MYPRKLLGFNPVDLYDLATGAAATEGSIAVMNSSGAVKDGADEASVAVIGVISEVDANSKIKVEAAPFQKGNSAIAPIARADRGSVCYLEDKDTVRKTAGSHSVVAGLVLDVDDDGVWIDMTPQGLAAARAAAVTGFTQMTEQAGPALDAPDITDSTGGTASVTHVMAAPAATDYTTAELKNNFATAAAEHNALKDDVAALETVLEALIDALQLNGFMA